MKTDSPREAGSQTDIVEVVEENRPDLDAMGLPNIAAAPLVPIPDYTYIISHEPHFRVNRGEFQMTWGEHPPGIKTGKFAFRGNTEVKV